MKPEMIKEAIKEVGIIKKDCESRILKAICDFEKITGMIVENVNIQSVRLEQDSYCKIVEVDLKIHLGGGTGI